MLIKLFADDAKLYSIVTSDNDNRVQFSLNRAVDWANVWRMIFNIIKCHHLHIGKNITGTRYTMVSENEEIELRGGFRKFCHRCYNFVNRHNRLLYYALIERATFLLYNDAKTMHEKK